MLSDDSHNNSTLDNEVKKLFQKNLKKIDFNKAQNKYLYYISPNSKALPDQYFLTSCLNIINNSHLNKKDAIVELKTLLSIQKDNGYIPYYKIWENNTDGSQANYSKCSESVNSMPILGLPFLALAFRKNYEILEKLPQFNSYLFQLNKYYDFIWNTRRKNNHLKSNLLYTIHPLECTFMLFPVLNGCNAGKLGGITKNNEELQPNSKNPSNDTEIEGNINKMINQKSFKTFDLLFNSCFIENCFILHKIYKKGGNDEEAQKWRRRAKLLQAEFIKKCWNHEEGLFFNIHCDNCQQIQIKTALSLTPLILEELPKKYVDTLVKNHLLNENEFWSDYPIPSIAIDEKFHTKQSEFQESSLKVSILINWLIIRGLMKHNYDHLGILLAQYTKELIQKSGFYQYYNSSTGEGVGVKNFSNSAILIDIEHLLFNGDLNFILNKDWMKIKRLPDF